MSEMIERVAEAIYNNWANYPTCSVSKSWQETCDKLPAQANDFRRKAKAAIQAMREPTEEMIKAGEHYMEIYSNGGGVWQAMIGAALNE